MIIPYSTEVLIKRWPISNLVIIALCIISFVMTIFGGFSIDVLEAMILDGWNPIGLVGHLFLHAGFLHIIFNMLYLWVFGNAVCEKIGSLAHAGVFLGTGVAAAAFHNLLDGNPAVGASGAINGIIGFYFVLFPVNRVNCFYWFLFRAGTFAVSGFWLILFWFAGDAWLAFSGTQSDVAYWAHVGGFLSGVVLGVLFLKYGWARMADYDNSTLLNYFKRKKEMAAVAYERRSFRTTPAKLADLPSLRRPVTPSPQASTKPPVSPAVKTDLNLDCPHCNQNMDVPQDMIGSSFRCPTCGGEIKLEEE